MIIFSISQTVSWYVVCFKRKGFGSLCQHFTLSINPRQSQELVAFTWNGASLGTHHSFAIWRAVVPTLGQMYRATWRRGPRCLGDDYGESWNGADELKTADLYGCWLPDDDLNIHWLMGKSKKNW